jgi:hypothetical protein
MVEIIFLQIMSDSFEAIQLDDEPPSAVDPTKDTPSTADTATTTTTADAAAASSSSLSSSSSTFSKPVDGDRKRNSTHKPVVVHDNDAVAVLAIEQLLHREHLPKAGEPADVYLEESNSNSSRPVEPAELPVVYASAKRIPLCDLHARKFAHDVYFLCSMH